MRGQYGVVRYQMNFRGAHNSTVGLLALCLYLTDAIKYYFKPSTSVTCGL